MAATADDPLKPANDLIRAAARWLVGSLGAIGALLIAGSQLSDIGTLEASEPRFIAALAGLALSLVAILIAIWQVTALLLPRDVGLVDLARQWERIDPGPNGVEWWRRWRYPALHYLSVNRDLLGGDENRTIPDVLSGWREASYDEDELAPLRDLIERILGVASHRTLLSDFRTKRWVVGTSVVLAAVGIGVFAWAANPPDGPRANLRNAQLVGADLTGVQLRDADLTGANLTGANLRGAQLGGATVKDVTWSDTTCPDGTNSDDVAVQEDAGQVLTGGTCEGHLSP